MSFEQIHFCLLLKDWGGHDDQRTWLMNSAACCHEVVGCPGLYVDAFRASFADKRRDPSCAFVLTHYHGDHYSGLPREFKYQGLALIHCTPVTAALLRTVHEVPSQFVMEHEYGSTWNFPIQSAEDGSKTNEQARVTFYDANHCPGAAIVFIEIPDGTCHLHSGDMRYHEKMKLYPLLQDASTNRKLDILYLDTTYGHPKHEFVPQDVAIETMASKVQALLGTKRSEEEATLVLLSCYSIGKEKVLWEASQRSNQLVYVTEKKFKMLSQIQQHQEMEVSSRIMERCTLDPSQSDLHVIPMGMAGEMFPYFQPNFKACADYAQQLQKKYQHVVAFLPTGWAVGSNWNKKNAVSTKRINGDAGSVDVEIRLVSYSEHSAFSELCSFVEYLRPRKVIPTVFSDEKDRRRIEGYFHNYIDSTRAKQQFFKSMTLPRSQQRDSNGAGMPEVDVRQSNCATDDCSESSHEGEVVVLETSKPASSHSDDNAKTSHLGGVSDQVATLVSMGFDRDAARDALDRQGSNVESALETLLSTKPALGNQARESDVATPVSVKRAQPCSPLITNFFAKKKR